MKLDQLKEIAAGATEGPYSQEWFYWVLRHAYKQSSHFEDHICDGYTAPYGEKDAKYFTTFNPQRVKLLLDEIENLRESIYLIQCKQESYDTENETLHQIFTICHEALKLKALEGAP